MEFLYHDATTSSKCKWDEIVTTASVAGNSSCKKFKKKLIDVIKKI